MPPCIILYYPATLLFSTATTSTLVAHHRALPLVRGKIEDERATTSPSFSTLAPEL